MPKQRNIEYKHQIKSVLSNALLLDGEMAYRLYEYELVEHIAYWKDCLKRDKEDFLFVVTVNNGDAAMLLITNNDEQYINEKARKHLKAFWQKNYRTNIEMLLPVMVKDLDNDFFSVTGVIIANELDLCQ
jgi:hypothetical protein